MSYIEKFIRGCFVQPKYSPHSFLTSIGGYLFGLVFIFLMFILSENISKDSFRYDLAVIFCILALIIIVLDLFGFFIKFWVDSDWPLLIMYLTSIASLYMVPLFTMITFDGQIKDLLISFFIVTVMAPICWGWFTFIMMIFKIDPMAYPKPHSIVFMGVQWFTIVGGIVSVIYTKVTGDMRYTIYTTTSIMAYFSPFFFMHFTRVFDY